VAAFGCGPERVAHQGRADAAAALCRIDGERPEQQRRAGRSGRHGPQPHGAYDAAVLDRDKAQPARRRPAGPQPLGGLLEADRAIGGVKQRLARGGVGRSLKANGQHGTLPVFLVPRRSGQGLGRRAAEPSPQAGKVAALRFCQM